MPKFQISRRRFAEAGAMLAAATPFGALAQETPRRGGVLIVAADGEPRNINPAIVASNGVFFMASKVIEPLAEMKEGGGFAPRLATSWEGSADGKTITFKLRSGVTWHDGKPFTSADVAFSALEVWKKLQNFGRVLFKELEAVDTPDAQTAIFKFAKPTPLQLIENALPALTSVLPKHVYEGSDIATNPANVKLVGTGPFKFAEYKPGEYYRLERNPNYWDEGKPWLDGIIFRVMPDRGAIAAATEANQIQLSAFSAVPLADLARIAKVPGVKVIADGYDGVTYQLIVEINNQKKELSDPRVRRAIAHAIDRTFVTDTIFLGTAKASNGPIPLFDRVMNDPQLAAPRFDVARANALLDEAGYPRASGGVRFSLKLLPAPWFEQTRQFGDYLRQALRAVGIDAQIVNNDPAGHTKAVYTDRAYDLAIGSPVYRNDPAISTTVLYQSGIPAGVPFANQYNYKSDEMDGVIAKAASEIDPAKRAALYRDFQQIANRDLPIIHVAEWTFITVARDSVRNVGNNPRWATSHWADAWLAA
ncbi:ABC transporter substrate-binding protein [Terrirubrum flagellatum]|uniref:ABC transporter substrate-binding protein n=1 Tax=Terrirubrum flagellatum TaxID=2895980 RepID=UPI003CC82A71